MEEILENEARPPPQEATQHPNQIFPIWNHLEVVKENLKTPYRAPAQPDDITIFEHGDLRHVATQEQIDRQRAAYAATFTRYADVNPTNDAEADALFQEMSATLLPGQEPRPCYQSMVWATGLCCL